MRYSEIVLRVGLDEQKVPVDIKWKASDSPMEHLTDTKAFNLSVWDPIKMDSLNLNLWTDTMQTHEMHTFFFQNLIQQVEAYERATGNPFARESVMNMIQDLSKKTTKWEEEKA